MRRDLWCFPLRCLKKTCERKKIRLKSLI
jgi:hypothetical protein